MYYKQKIYQCEECGLETFCDDSESLTECPCCDGPLDLVDDIFFFDED